MNLFLRTTSVSVLLAVTAQAGEPAVALRAVADEALSNISAVMVSNVQDAASSRGESEADATLLTVYTGPAVAPFTTYIKIFDPIPQNGGDYGTFKVFKVPQMMNDFPKRMKVDYSRSGKSIYVGFNAVFFDSFAENGEPKYAKGRMIAKFSLAEPITEGAIAPNAELTIRR